MKKLKNYTSKDYAVALIPAIILAAFSEIMFLWNFADTLRRTAVMIGKVPSFSPADASDTLYLNLCVTADSFALVLTYAFFIAVLYSIKKAATPFSAFVGKGMRAIAVSMILPYAFNFVLKRILIVTFAEPTEDYLGYFGYGGIAIAGLLFVFSLVFDYGCELQRESDETL